MSGKPPLPVIKGRVEDELVTSSEFSSSPHRTLTQTEPRGIGQPVFAESGSGSYSPSSLPADMFRTVTQQRTGGVAEEEESDLVQHKGKSGKGKPKKKKKKKKSKTAESAVGSHHTASDVVAESGNAEERARMEGGGVRVAADSASGEPEKRSPVVEVKEVIGQSTEVAAEKEPVEVADQNTSSVVEVGGHNKSIVESPDEFPWEQWAPSDGGTEQVSQEGGGAERASLEEGGGAELGDYLEECDVGFPRELHPLPLPQSTGKRLSLADELEMAIGSEPVSPSPPSPDQTATPPTSHTHPGVEYEPGVVNESSADQNTPSNDKTTGRCVGIHHTHDHTPCVWPHPLQSPAPMGALP